MVLYPADLKYSPHHVWVKCVNETEAIVGITDDVQDQIEVIESVDLPIAGDELEIDCVCMSFHVKNGLYDIYSPLSGRIIATNELLIHHPEDIFLMPYGDGWLFRMEFDEPEELEMMMGPKEYAEMLD